MANEDNGKEINARFIEWPGLKVYTPICKSCINYISYYPQFKSDECKVFGKIPFEYDGERPWRK